MRIAWPYIKSTKLLDGGRMLIKTPSGFKIIASESQMGCNAIIIPLGKHYERFYAAPPNEKSRAAHHYEEHHVMQVITDHCVPDLNTSGTVRTSVCELLPVPSTDVKVWTSTIRNEPSQGVIQASGGQAVLAVNTQRLAKIKHCNLFLLD